MQRLFFLFFSLFLFHVGLHAQLACQPMVGHVGLRDARIWIQAEDVAKGQIECWVADAPQSTEVHRSDVQMLKNGRANTATFDLGGLEPGTSYSFRILINGQEVTQGIDVSALRFETQPLWQYRTDPPEFTIAVGSCSYINETAYDRPGGLPVSSGDTPGGPAWG